MYTTFWTMMGVSAFVNNFYVKPRMAAGPPDGSTCPPFDRVSTIVIRTRQECVVYAIHSNNLVKHAELAGLEHRWNILREGI